MVNAAPSTDERTGLFVPGGRGTAGATRVVPRMGALSIGEASGRTACGGRGSVREDVGGGSGRGAGAPRIRRLPEARGYRFTEVCAEIRRAWERGRPARMDAVAALTPATIRGQRWTRCGRDA